MMFRDLAAAILVGLFAAAAAHAEPHYTGNFDTRWEADGRHMITLSPVAYIDAKGQIWSVPVGAELDGASVPRWAWSAVGGPFEGKYRQASVIHDWYCDHRVHTWRDTDRMFLEAMLTSGVNPLQAQTFYFAVIVGGPKWDDQAIHNAQLADQQVAPVGGHHRPVDLRALVDQQVDAARRADMARMAFVQAQNGGGGPFHIGGNASQQRLVLDQSQQRLMQAQQAFQNGRLATLRVQAIADVPTEPTTTTVNADDPAVKAALAKVMSTTMSADEIDALAATLNTAPP